MTESVWPIDEGSCVASWPLLSTDKLESADAGLIFLFFLDNRMEAVAALSVQAIVVPSRPRGEQVPIASLWERNTVLIQFLRRFG